MQWQTVAEAKIKDRSFAAEEPESVQVVHARRIGKNVKEPLLNAT